MGNIVAIVGRPNVGKSTLFNVLTKTRDALVADFPGLTRDRKYGHGVFENRNYIVIDTGGLSGESEELDERMGQQTLLAIEEANIIFFLVDARHDLTAADVAGSFPLIRILEDNAAQCTEVTGVPAPFVNDGG